MPAQLAALFLFIAMVLVLCVPPVILIRMLMRRQALVTEPQRPMVQAAVISAGCALLFNAVVCLFARPDIRDSEALWGSITAVHVAALLLSWLAFWGCVALAVLLRPRRNANQTAQPEAGGGEMA